MARILSTLVALACVLLTMAAPHGGRATGAAECDLVTQISGIQEASTRLGAINTTLTDGDLLKAQLALVDANTGVKQISLSALANAPPAPPNATATIVSGLTASLASLNKVVLFISNDTKAAVAAANSSINAALATAQTSLTGNCPGTPQFDSAAFTAARDAAFASASASEAAAKATASPNARQICAPPRC
ncbi:hypothetical protein C8R47DRAFT_711169 [Mycena vitilis]|nr:hypothetical protein C8R47DRAFT_711169 [Mycena vitilis]